MPVMMMMVTKAIGFFFLVSGELKPSNNSNEDEVSSIAAWNAN